MPTLPTFPTLPTAVSELRKSVTEATPVLAVVGATDLAVERVRTLAARAEQAAASIDSKTLQSTAVQVPALAVSRALEVAGQFESRYEDLAARGKALVQRVQSQRATKDLVTQGKATLSRTKAAVTTARKTADAAVEAAEDALPKAEPVRTRPATKRAATRRARPTGSK
jgi:heparin binding hemagglutinin HbhA